MQRPRILKYRLLSTCRRVSGDAGGAAAGALRRPRPGRARRGGAVRLAALAALLQRLLPRRGRRRGGGDRDRRPRPSSTTTCCSRARVPGIRIGRDGLFGAHVEIFDSDFHDLDPARRHGGHAADRRRSRSATTSSSGMGVRDPQGRDDRRGLGDRRRLGGHRRRSRPASSPPATRRAWSASSERAMDDDVRTQRGADRGRRRGPALDHLRPDRRSRCCCSASMVVLARLIPPAAFGIFADRRDRPGAGADDADGGRRRGDRPAPDGRAASTSRPACALSLAIGLVLAAVTVADLAGAGRRPLFGERDRSC